MVNQSATPSSEPCAAIDNLFLFCETEELPMNIACVWEFPTVMSRDEVMEINRPLMESDEYRRYRQIIVGDPEKATARWTDIAKIDMGKHVFEHKLGGKATIEEVQALSGKLFSSPLDRTMPLWDCHLITGLATGGCVLVYRLHHAITDGQGSVRALLSVTSSGEGVETEQYSAVNRGSIKKQQSATAKTKKTFQEELLACIKITQAWFIAAIFFIQCMLQATWDCIVIGVRPKRSFVNPAPHPEGQKAVAWTEGVLLDDVKRVKNAYKMTVNDVVLSCAAGAIRDYMLENNEPVQDLVCGIPFSMRRADDFSLSNHATMAMTFLPVSMESPIDRMNDIHNRMNMLKLSPFPSIMYSFVNMLYLNRTYLACMKMYDSIIMRYGQTRMQAVLTNVPGPSSALFIGGHKLTGYAPMVPQVNRSSLGMGVMSYDGKVFFGLLTEEGNLVGGPRNICDKFNSQFAMLLQNAKEIESASKRA
eukprot:CFRG7451T1